MNHNPRALLRAMFDAAIAAALPDKTLPAYLPKPPKGRTLVIVEHDMGVVFDLADRISVLVYGAIIATDVPERIRQNTDVQTAYLGAATHA